VRRVMGSIFLAGGLLLGGCGYHHTGLSGLPPALAGKRIFVATFTNRGYRANMGAILTGSLIDEFARRTGGLVVAEKIAELKLDGTILSYTTTAISFTAVDTVKEYRASVTAECSLTERGSGKVVWKGTVTQWQDYPVNTAVPPPQSSDAVALQQNSEDAAIREISRKIAQQVYQDVSDGF
jgi:outer membrane lipopolysaccharide assembly protein LptE/RlpB